jgi:hypothetical protein
MDYQEVTGVGAQSGLALLRRRTPSNLKSMDAFSSSIFTTPRYAYNGYKHLYLSYQYTCMTPSSVHGVRWFMVLARLQREHGPALTLSLHSRA